MGPMQKTREFPHPETGQICTASVAPVEKPHGGVRRHLWSVVFETAEGEWIGSIILPIEVDLSFLTVEELQVFLMRAEMRS